MRVSVVFFRAAANCNTTKFKIIIIVTLKNVIPVIFSSAKLHTVCAHSKFFPIISP